MDIHVYVYMSPYAEKLDKILEAIKTLQGKEENVMAELDNLKANVANLIAQVQANGTVIGSAVAAFQGLTAQMKVLTDELAAAIAAGDPVQIQAAADAIAAQNQLVADQTNALAAAIPQNTPMARK